MSDVNLAKKLLIKPGQRLGVINAAPGFPADLGILPDGVIVTDKLDKPLGFVLIFTQTNRDVARLLPEVLKVLKIDGMLWVCYPKGTSKLRTDLNRDILWNMVGKYGLVGVAMVSLDNVWSAMRLRPKAKVGKSKDS